MTTFHIGFEAFQAIHASGQVGNILDYLSLRQIKGAHLAMPPPPGPCVTQSVSDFCSTLIASMLALGDNFKTISIHSNKTVRADGCFTLVLEKGQVSYNVNNAIQILTNYVRLLACATDVCIYITADVSPDVDAMSIVGVLMNLPSCERILNTLLSDIIMSFKADKDTFASVNFKDSLGCSAYSAERHAEQMTPEHVAGVLTNAYTLMSYFNNSSYLFRNYFDGLRLELKCDGNCFFSVSDLSLDENSNDVEALFGPFCDGVPGPYAENCICRRHIWNEEREEVQVVYSNHTPEGRFASVMQCLSLYDSIRIAIRKIVQIGGGQMSIGFNHIPNTNGMRALEHRDAMARYIDQENGVPLENGLSLIMNIINAHPDTDDELMDDEKFYIALYDIHSVHPVSFYRKLWQAVWAVTHHTDKLRVMSSVMTSMTTRINRGTEFFRRVYNVNIKIEPVKISI